MVQVCGGVCLGQVGIAKVCILLLQREREVSRRQGYTGRSTGTAGLGQAWVGPKHSAQAKQGHKQSATKNHG